MRPGRPPKIFYATEKRVTGKYGQGYNLSDHIDFQYLPGKKWDHFFDPEGYVSTIPAIVTCLLGVFAGLLLKSDKTTGQQKVIYLVAFGIAGAVAGWLWNLQFPVIKKIWTSSTCWLPEVTALCFWLHFISWWMF